MPLYSIEFNNRKDLDARVYNPPPINNTEVAAIFLGTQSKADRERTLTITNRFVDGWNNFSIIYCTFPQADALCYPLLFSPAPERRRRQAAAAHRRRRFVDDVLYNFTYFSKNIFFHLLFSLFSILFSFVLFSFQLYVKLVPFYS